MTPHVTLHGSPGLQSKRWSSIQTRGISRSIRSDPLNWPEMKLRRQSVCHRLNQHFFLCWCYCCCHPLDPRPKCQVNKVTRLQPCTPFSWKRQRQQLQSGPCVFRNLHSPIGAAVGACAGRVFPTPDVWDHKRTSCSNKPETIKSFQRIHGLAGQSSRARQGFLHAFDPWGLRVCIAAPWRYRCLRFLEKKNNYRPVIQHCFWKTRGLV